MDGHSAYCTLYSIHDRHVFGSSVLGSRTVNRSRVSTLRNDTVRLEESLPGAKSNERKDADPTHGP